MTLSTFTMTVLFLMVMPVTSQAQEEYQEPSMDAVLDMSSLGVNLGVAEVCQLADTEEYVRRLRNKLTQSLYSRKAQNQLWIYFTSARAESKANPDLANAEVRKFACDNVQAGWKTGIPWDSTPIFNYEKGR